MHIAYLTPEYPHPEISHSGGMGTSIRNLANALVKQGHQITVFVYGQQINKVFKDHGIQFHLIVQKKYSLGGFYLYRKYIERYINKHSNGIDIIEAPDWTGINAFMTLKKPLVIRFHGSDFIGGDSNDLQTGSNSTWELLQASFSKMARNQITYLGKVPYHQVQEEIKKAHVCVFPSLAETLGMVTIESMALGKAVVNTDIGWAKDLIQHDHDGFMHHPDDMDSYVNTIKRLFDDPDTVSRIGENAMETIMNRFDIEKIAIKNIAFYSKLLEQ